ncbi:MAG: GAF domain-containing sensor histidine kinase [Candidatus Omnitrophota bacterium]
MQKARQLEQEAEELKKSLDNMDEQAKIIVRTDIELNRIQEELDKKISGLYALQRLSHSISMTLVEDQIFQRLSPEYIDELGFEKSLVFLWDKKSGAFLPKTALGYMEEEKELISSHLNGNKEKFLSLIEEDKTLSSITTPDNFIDKNTLHSIFKANYFIMAPILPKQSECGFIFIGTGKTETLITEGDEELIKILATQLGQALENARLFEKTWNSQQELEEKVGARTQELTAALEEVKKMNKRKTDFVSSVSHELRTPLTSIKGYAAILLTGKLGEIPAEAKQRLEKINRHSDELGHIVNELLDISRIESGKVTMSLEPCDLREVINKIEDLLSGQLKEKKINLDILIPPNDFRILIDQTQIGRVFINLVGNAMKFTPAEGKISISAKKIEGLIQIDVSDTGCGIPQEAKDSIFEEFFRVENTINQEVKGTGLGLALVKRIIEAHQGRIWVDSIMGKGTTFSFTLPQG